MVKKGEENEKLMKIFLCVHWNRCFQDSEKWNNGCCLKILFVCCVFLLTYVESFTAFLVHSSWVNMIDYIGFSEVRICTRSLTKEGKNNQRSKKKGGKKDSQGFVRAITFLKDQKVPQ